MKNVILKILFILSILILIGEEYNTLTITLKIISLLYMYIFLKANKYID